MNTRIAFGTILVLGLFAQVTAQTSEQRGAAVRPAQTVEERVSDEFKEKQLRKAAEEKLATEQSNRIANVRPASLLSQARTIYINSDTKFFEEVQLQNALRKRSEFRDWELTVIDGWDNAKIADLLIEVDRPLFTYTYTYEIMARGTGMVIATGKVIAFDGNMAAPKLAARIIEDLRQARESRNE